VRESEFRPETATLDKGYDVGPVYEACEGVGAIPIIPLRKTPAVKRGEHRAPECEHGTWTFAGADAKRKATEWRCPAGECSPASRWIKADRLHPLIPRESKRFGDLYRGRGAVERAFGRLKNEYGLKPLRVRGIERVALDALPGVALVRPCPVLPTDPDAHRTVRGRSRKVSAQLSPLAWGKSAASLVVPARQRRTRAIANPKRW
jgi:hypothetical protein